MIYYITTLKDTAGNNYIGIDIPKPVIEPFLNELSDILEDEFDEYVKYQQNRDHDSYHITVINAMEYNKISKEIGIKVFVESLELIFKYPIDDIKMLGLGTASRNENRTYFVVCKSDKLDAVRKRFELPEQHFHVTLGFLYKDVFGVAKNILLEKEDRFLKLLKIEYYKNDNWNFLKKIGNWNLDKNCDITPINLDNSRLKVKCNDHYMDIGLLEDKLWIMSQYLVEKDIPRLAETEIAKILNKNK